MNSSEAASPGTSGARGRKAARRFRGWFWRIFAVSLLLVLGLLAFQSWPLFRADLNRREARAEIINALAAASTPEAMAEVAFVYVLPDDTWVATEYRDSHSWPGYSVAIAVTSDGAWYESREHHCGGFWSYAATLRTRQLAFALAPAEIDEEYQQLLDGISETLQGAEFAPLAEAATLAEAKRALRALGFAPRRTSHQPALRGRQQWPAPSADVLTGDATPRVITGRTLDGDG